MEAISIPVNAIKKIECRENLSLNELNDDISLKDFDNPRLSKLSFWYDENYIHGYQAYYCINNMFDVMGHAKLISNSLENYIIASIDIDNDDNKIIKIEGRYDDMGLRGLEIITTQKVKKFGSFDDKKDLKKFVINFDDNEELLKVFGCLNVKEGNIYNLK